jgi:hypothetical protein
VADLDFDIVFIVSNLIVVCTRLSNHSIVAEMRYYNAADSPGVLEPFSGMDHPQSHGSLNMLCVHQSNHQEDSRLNGFGRIEPDAICGNIPQSHD